MARTVTRRGAVRSHGDVVGLDLSLTATGVATAAGPEVLKPMALSGPERLRWIRHEVLLRTHGAELVTLEGYAFSAPKAKGSASRAHALGELGGVIRLALWEAGQRVLVVPPTVVKVLATGKGNAGKNEVLTAAVRRLGYEGSDDNESDALWLRLYGMLALGLPVGVDLPQTHLRALDKVDWNAG